MAFGKLIKRGAITFTVILVLSVFTIQYLMTSSHAVPDTITTEDVIEAEPTPETNIQKALNFLKSTPQAKKIPNIIHQQYSSWEKLNQEQLENARSFQRSSPNHLYLFWSDAELTNFINTVYPEYSSLYHSLPRKVLKSDLARYLLLYAFGGVYSDIDTVLLKPIEEWTRQDPAFICGIEADTEREDWAKWYPRSLMFTQWTMASAPKHPILKDVIDVVVKKLVENPNVSNGDVVHVTGPGPWTDSIMSYIQKYGASVAQLRNLKFEVGFEDVLIFPITAFSPGVGHMGSEGMDHPQARVWHKFAGSWKNGN